MKKFNAFLVSVLATAALNAAVIEQVIVRQQWPWSTDVKVEYKISAVTNPVDIAIQTYNGTTELSLPDAAITGDRYGISEDGVGTLIIDPVAAFGTEKVALANFKVKLTVTEAAAAMMDELYCIVDLKTGSVTSIRRRDFYNGVYGPYETLYSRIGPGFSTALENVLVWTGVTNDLEFATTKLVMRRIPAKDVEWLMGKPEGCLAATSLPATSHLVKLTKDYYVAVFPMTQAQLETACGTRGYFDYTNRTLYADADLKPTLGNDHQGLRGGQVEWPADGHRVTDGSLIGRLRALVHNRLEFDLPTEAQWEFAYRAGLTNHESEIYTSKNWTYDSLVEIGWGNENSGTLYGGVAQPVRIGCKPPNAYGLYDMGGNVFEWCLDYGDGDYAWASKSVPEIDPRGKDKESVQPDSSGFYHRVVRCGAWSGDRVQHSAIYRSRSYWGTAVTGFRLVAPAD